MPVTYPLTPLGTAFVLIATILLPLGAMQAAQRVRKPGGIPGRGQLLVSVLIQQAILLALSLVTARVEHVTLFPAPHFGLAQAAMGAGFLAVGLGALPMRWNWRTVDEKKRMLWRIPNRVGELWGWMLVSFGAGLAEEVLYRGMMLQLWLRVLGAWWPAMLICVAAFALAHFVAGWRSMLIIALMAFVTHLIVRACGDLYAAIGMHALYDLLAGAMLVQLAKRDGLLPAPAATAAPSRGAA